jgi:hypothetical protein
MSKGLGRAAAPRAWPIEASPQRYGDLLPKPDRAASLPAEAANGAGRACLVIVRGCPLGNGRDRCEWHANGTAAWGDLARRGMAALAPP